MCTNVIITNDKKQCCCCCLLSKPIKRQNNRYVRYTSTSLAADSTISGSDAATIDPPVLLSSSDVFITSEVFIDPVVETTQILLEQGLNLNYLIASNQANGLMYVSAIALQQRTNTIGMAATTVGVVFLFDLVYIYKFDITPLY